MNNKMRKMGVLALTFTLLLGGCTLTERLEPADTVQSGQTAKPQADDRIGLAYYAAEKVNPVTSMSEINVILCDALYESLFVLDETFTPQESLCTEYAVSANGLVYTFTVKEGITFWSGQPLTAADVAETYRLVKNSPGTRYYTRFSEVTKIKAIDDDTVEITLAQPNAEFLSLLDIPIFRAGTQNEDFSEGTGPFMPVRENGEYHLSAYPDWHGETNPEIDRIDLITTVRAKSVVYSFSTGDVSMTRVERISDDPVSLSGAVDIYQTPSTELHYLGANMKNPLLAQPEFRRAVSALIDRTEICKNALQTYADPALLPQNPQPEFVTEQSFAADAAQATALLSQIGVADSNGDGVLDYAAEGILTRQPVHLRILVNEENLYKQAVLSQICLSLGQAGIQTEIVSVDFETYLAELAAGNYDLYYGDVVLQPDFDMRALIATAGKLNYGGYSDLTMDGLLTVARTGADGQTEHSFQQYFLQQMPVIPIAFERMQVVLRGGLLQNYQTAPAQMFISYPMWRKGS